MGGKKMTYKKYEFKKEDGIFFDYEAQKNKNWSFTNNTTEAEKIRCYKLQFSSIRKEKSAKKGTE